MTVLITELVRADIAGSIMPILMMISIGLGLIGLGMWGRKKTCLRNIYRRSLPGLGRREMEKPRTKPNRNPRISSSATRGSSMLPLTASDNSNDV